MTGSSTTPNYGVEGLLKRSSKEIRECYSTNSAADELASETRLFDPQADTDTGGSGEWISLNVVNGEAVFSKVVATADFSVGTITLPVDTAQRPS